MQQPFEFFKIKHSFLLFAIMQPIQATRARKKCHTSKFGIRTKNFFDKISFCRFLIFRIEIHCTHKLLTPEEESQRFKKKNL